MKINPEKYLSNSDWLFVKSKYDQKTQSEEETLLSLANGYFGSRGILEETPEGSTPGSFFAGIYDKTSSRVEELVNFPEPFNLRISASGGEKLDVSACQVISHKRILDIKKALLFRSDVFRTVNSGRILYQSLRFISKNDPHIAVEQAAITPLDKKANLSVKTSIETGIYNEGMLSEGRKKHFNVYEYKENKRHLYLSVKTLSRKILVGYAQKVCVENGSQSIIRGTNLFKMSLPKNETLFITKFISFYTSLEIGKKELKKKTISKVNQSCRKGFPLLLKEHAEKWKKIWDKVDIKIKGDKKINLAIRFNLYHLLINTPLQFIDASIGARGLSEGYKGHIFWDTEIFILPFFIYNFPSIAKNLLLYRYKRLKVSKKQAKEKGFKGALFAWESAESGFDQTPPWVKTPEGKVVRVVTGKYEHHITADIAYAFYNYFKITGDLKFLLDYGIEVILETAKFWISRLTFNEKKNRYEILKVIPPDEIHQKVNNSFFTNYMAKFNIKLAISLVEKYKKGRYSEKINNVLKKTGLKIENFEKWSNIANNIYLPLKNGLFEEFENYFNKIDVLKKNRKFPPAIPRNIDLEKTKIVKQADIVLLFHLFPFNFTLKEKKKNFDFYEKRTWHLSSLSPSIHSIIASNLGYKKKAYDYFLKSLFVDLKNIYKNTKEGIHLANVGGLWQAIVFGFAGLNNSEGKLTIKPSLPPSWKKLSFKLNYKGKEITVKI